MDKKKHPKVPFTRGNTKYIWIIELIFAILIISDILIGILIEDKTGVIVLSCLIIWFMTTIIAFYVANSKIRGGRSKLSWLLGFICFPIISHVFFFIWASNPFKYSNKTKYIERSERFVKLINYDETHKFLNNEKISKYDEHLGFYKTFKITHNLLNANIQTNYHVDIIESNPLLYQKTIELIRSAKKFIFMSYYIIGEGFWFNKIKSELIKKANEGVKIYIIYDWYGCVGTLKLSTIKQLSKIPNINIAKFKAKSDFVLRWTNNFRNHDKLLLIDNKIALYGGSNLSDEYLNMKKNIHNWADLNFVVKGKIVENLAISFLVDWQYYTTIINKEKVNYYLLDYLIDNNLWVNIEPVSKSENGLAFYSQTCPDYYPFLLDNQLDVSLNSAKKEIKIITPYLLPTGGLMNTLRTILNSGIKVSIILPGAPDNKRLMLNINRSYYSELLSLGCNIYEYPGFIHAKLLAIDNEISTIGTYNFDLRSLLINYESAIWFNDKQITKNLNQTFDNLVKVCNKVNDEYLNKVYKLWDKIQVYFSQIFAGLL